MAVSVLSNMAPLGLYGYLVPNYIKNCIPQSHSPHFKCLIANVACVYRLDRAEYKICLWLQEILLDNTGIDNSIGKYKTKHIEETNHQKYGQLEYKQTRHSNIQTGIGNHPLKYAHPCNITYNTENRKKKKIA